MRKYKIIYADPPWSFNNKNTGGSMKSGASNQYDVMSIDDLCNLDVESLCADDCVLVMWWVGSQPEEAIKLCKAWGFAIKNMNGIVWRKLTKNLLPHFGMGFWTRAGSESCLIAVRGKPKPFSHSVRAVIEAVAERHSEKPDAVRKAVVDLCGDVPRLEMFARCAPQGWDVFGNEAPNSINIPMKRDDYAAVEQELKEDD